MRRVFNSFNEYCAFYESHEHKLNDVDFVCNGGNERANACWDGEFDTKSVKVAMNRFFKACSELDRFSLEGLENVRESSEDNRFFFTVERPSESTVYIAFGCNHPEFWTVR